MTKPIDRLLEVMAVLRSEKGCPWDRKQTIATLKPYIIEEAFEVVDAIDQGGRELVDELGDLLLQVVFAAQIASEEGKFSFDDVASSITEKLVRRHPHVFGETVVKDADEVITNWNRIKKEREEKKYLLDGVPSAMPSAILAQRYTDRAASVGFDWEKWEDVLPKIDEELDELKESIATGDRDEIFHEMGDLLFAVVNLSRKLGINSDEALRACSARFRERFNKMEDLNPAVVDGTMDIDSLEELWQEAKRSLKKEKES